MTAGLPGAAGGRPAGRLPARPPARPLPVAHSCLSSLAAAARPYARLRSHRPPVSPPPLSACHLHLHPFLSPCLQHVPVCPSPTASQCPSPALAPASLAVLAACTRQLACLRHVPVRLPCRLTVQLLLPPACLTASCSFASSPARPSVRQSVGPLARRPRRTRRARPPHAHPYRPHAYSMHPFTCTAWPCP